MKRLLALFCTSACLSAVSVAAADVDHAGKLELHGFTIEYANVGLDRLQRMQASLESQIAIVEQSNVPPATQEYFKSVPVIIVSELDRGFGRARVDEKGRQIVELKAAKLPSDRPILLHELLHAYHGEKLGPTPMIRNSYRQAVQSGIYKRYPKAHFLDNPGEYFAVIGSIFLFGKKIDQPPFDCELPARYQPQFIAFLTTQFGEHLCR